VFAWLASSAAATLSGVAENRSRIMREAPSAWEMFSEHFATGHAECGDCQSASQQAVVVVRAQTLPM
jgi:hypothetical protein